MEFFNCYVSEKSIFLINKVLQTRQLNQGQIVDEFEKQLQEKLGLVNPVTTNSGTSALFLALKLRGVQQGDEVILPAQTFVATGMAILMCSAKPIFADINPKTGLICPKSIKEKLTNKTKAVIPVSWAGLPNDLDKIYQVIPYYVTIIEDAAHALGAFYNEIPVGGCKYVGFTCFSLQCTKSLTSSDGGILCCTDWEDRNDAKKMRWFGIGKTLPCGELGEREFDIDQAGYKMHMNDVSAAIGLGNLQTFQQRLQKRQQIGHKYREELKNISGVELLELPSDRTHAYLFFPMLVEKRLDFVRAMKARGIPTSVVCSRIDKYQVFGGKREDLPGQDYFDQKHIALPCHDELTEHDIDSVISAVKEGW